MIRKLRYVAANRPCLEVAHMDTRVPIKSTPLHVCIFPTLFRCVQLGAKTERIETLTYSHEVSIVNDEHSLEFVVSGEHTSSVAEGCAGSLLDVRTPYAGKEPTVIQPAALVVRGLLILEVQ